MRKLRFRPPYSIGEEIAHSISHGIGFMLSVAGLTTLVVLAAVHKDALHVVGFSIYGVTLILMYLSSTLYHSFQTPSTKRVLQIFDYICIYLLIAGTYTPFILIGMQSLWGYFILGMIWTFAIGCVIFILVHYKMWKRLSLLLYLVPGWMAVLIWSDLQQAVPPEGQTLLVIGGLIYSIGAIFYAIKTVPYFHFVWHLFVLGGSICHYFAVMQYLYVG